jgi:DNA-binding transcriptional ArsR family regulator
MASEPGKARGGGRKKPPPPDPNQQTFGRGEQLMILRKFVIPEATGEVSAANLKLIILNIADRLGRNSECWPCQDTIAAETGIKKRHLQRALAVLERMNLIYVRRGRRPQGGRGGTTNRYRLIWNELKLLCPRGLDQADGYFEEGDQRASTGALISTTNAPTATDQRASTGATNAPVLAHKPPIEPPKNRPPPADAENDWRVVVEEFRSRQTIAGELADECRRAGMTPAQFRERMRAAWATVELPANAGKFLEPAGAVAWFLRTGVWPTSGVITPQILAKRRATAAAEAEKSAVERAKRMREETEGARAGATMRQRNATYGGILDMLGRDELRELIDLTPSLRDPFHAEAVRRAVLDPPPNGLVRSRLLETLEQLEATPADFASSAAAEQAIDLSYSIHGSRRSQR